MEQLPDPKHQRLLEWLCTLRRDRIPTTWAGLAEELGVNVRTLRDWREKPEFVKAHEAMVRQVGGSPERTQEVLNALYETAIKGEAKNQVAAAKTWLDATGFIRDQVKQPEADAKSLTNKQIEDLIQKKATEIADARGLLVPGVN